MRPARHLSVLDAAALAAALAATVPTLACSSSSAGDTSATSPSTVADAGASDADDLGDGPNPPGVFVQPYQTCRDPLAGEPAGHSPGGKVCTWTLISGCTEEGRRYQDYASCDDVRSNRPYYPTPPAHTTPANDPRLTDATYQAELAWVTGQVEASACICCHSSAVTPKGPSQWFIEAPGVWTDSISDTGVAMLAGLADSTALGAYPADQNNGFDRTALGMPTTDVARMRKFLLAEYARRGLTPADAAKVPPFGGPLVSQLAYQPKACTGDEGVAPDGTVTWSGGSARYVYVLEADAKSPGVPPNLDVPAGTVWLVDVPTKAKPLGSGLDVVYGQVSGHQRQRVPAAGTPAPKLTSGKQYYLYVLLDVGFPVTRCLFTAP